MHTPPTGTVTFLFTDIEGSTKLSQTHPDQWESLRQRHQAILRDVIASHDGFIFQDVGDAFCAAFQTAQQAVMSAISGQQALFEEPWDPVPIRVRMGIHTGTADFVADGNRPDYQGYNTLVLANRIMSAGHGGQILLSGSTRELIHSTLPAGAELVDLGQKRLKDLMRPEQLSQLNFAGLPASYPPLKTLDSFPNNLPVQLTTFIGREKEMADIRDELQSHRLVTLTGSGGTGKTRLSLQLAAELLEAFPDGIWFVELAPLTDPALIPQTILAAIGITNQSTLPPMEILKEYLASRHVLIVLDNCEHLIEACSKLTGELLNAAPGLKILASSREALGVRGEASYRIPSLSLPDPKHLPAGESLTRYEAVRLFIDRALLVSPHFTVDRDNAPYIAQICFRLDGIPLAIELAAARINLLTLAQISDRLDDRFRLLTGGSRTALPRQQTLRALIDWSYDLLAEPERLLLQRLSAFMGGWTLEAAEQVCAGEKLDTYAVMDLLGQLINKSLISVVECSDCTVMRYRMNETIRQYAREKLLDGGSVEALRQRHLAYFLELTRLAYPHLTTPDQVSWLNRLEAELDNLRLALEWALSVDVPAGLLLTVSSSQFWIMRADPHEFIERLADLLEQYPLEDTLRARAMTLLGFQLGMRSEYSSSYEMLEKSLSLSRRLSDRQDEARSLLGLGIIITATGDHKKGVPIMEQSLSLYRDLGDSLGQAEATGWLTLQHNDIQHALSLAIESVNLYRQVGHLSGIANRLIELARMQIWSGDLESPPALLEEAQQLNHQLDDVNLHALTLQVRGKLSYWQADYSQAAACYTQSYELGDRNVRHLFSIWSRIGLAYVLHRQGEHIKSAELFEYCALDCLKTNDLIGAVYSIEGYASLLLTQGQLERALQLFSWSDAMREKVGDDRPPIEVASVEKDRAELRSRLGEAPFADLSARGRTLTNDQVVALAFEA